MREIKCASAVRLRHGGLCRLTYVTHVRAKSNAYRPFRVRTPFAGRFLFFFRPWVVFSWVIQVAHFDQTQFPTPPIHIGLTSEASLA